MSNKVTPRRAGKQAMAIHVKKGDGSAHVVGIGNLRVMVMNDDGSWFAQALEIDYAAEGTSLEDAQQRFENGLDATIREHLRLHGSLDRLLRPAPAPVWRELFAAAPAPFRFSQLSVHEFPFEGIAYFVEKKAA